MKQVLRDVAAALDHHAHWQSTMPAHLSGIIRAALVDERPDESVYEILLDARRKGLDTGAIVRAAEDRLRATFPKHVVRDVNGDFVAEFESLAEADKYADRFAGHHAATE